MSTMSLAEALRSFGNVSLPASQQKRAGEIVYKAMGQLKGRFQGSHQRADVEDAVNQVFTNLYSSNKFTGAADEVARSYLWSSIRNALNQKYRRDKSQRRLAQGFKQEQQSVAVVTSGTGTTSGHPATSPQQEAQRLEAEHRDTLNRFFGDFMEVIAERGFKRQDGRENFLKSIMQLRALSEEKLTKDDLILVTQQPSGGVGQLRSWEQARDALDQRFTRTRRQINKTLKAIKVLCAALAKGAEAPLKPTPYATIAQHVHETLIQCDELPFLEQIMKNLRLRRPKQVRANTA